MPGASSPSQAMGPWERGRRAPRGGTPSPSPVYLGRWSFLHPFVCEATAARALPSLPACRQAGREGLPPRHVPPRSADRDHRGGGSMPAGRPCAARRANTWGARGARRWGAELGPRGATGRVPWHGARRPRYCCGRSPATAFEVGRLPAPVLWPDLSAPRASPAINHSALGGSGERGVAGRMPMARGSSPADGTSQNHVVLGSARPPDGAQWCCRAGTGTHVSGQLLPHGPAGSPGGKTDPGLGFWGKSRPGWKSSWAAGAQHAQWTMRCCPCRGRKRVPAPCPAAPSAPKLPAGLSAGGTGLAWRLPSLFRAFPGFYCLPLLVPPSSQEAPGPCGAGGSVPGRTTLPDRAPPCRGQRHSQRPNIPAPASITQLAPSLASPDLCGQSWAQPPVRGVLVAAASMPSPGL